MVYFLHCVVNLSPVNPRTSRRSWLNTPDPSDKMLLIYWLCEYCPTGYCRVCTTFLLFECNKPTLRIVPAKVVEPDALLLRSAPVLFNFQFLRCKFRRSRCPAQLNPLPAPGGWRSIRPTQRPATCVNFSPISFSIRCFHRSSQAEASLLVTQQHVFMVWCFSLFFSCHIVGSLNFPYCVICWSSLSIQQLVLT